MAQHEDGKGEEIVVESTEQSSLRGKRYFTVRSSALFYATSKEGMDTEVSFLNHFLLKRGIKKVIAFISFRDMSGKLWKRLTVTVQEPKVYSFRVSQYCGDHFEGSADVEFYSVENIFVPYSAVSVIYSCSESLCQMHSYTRIYNAHEAEEPHFIPTGEEAGWTIRDNEAGTESVAYIHNGREAHATAIEIELVNAKGERQFVQLPVQKLAPFATVALVPSQHFDVRNFLGTQIGQAAISFKTAKVFPRILCGNRRLSRSGLIVDFQVTHSNFNYAKFGTPRLPAGELGYSFTPTVKPCEKLELHVFPHFENTEDIVARTKAGMAKISQESGSLLAVAPGEEVEFSTADPRGLPNRVVNSLLLHYASDRLPADCSGGIFTSGYIADNKHWYWGIGSTDGCQSSLSCTLGSRFLATTDFKKDAQITLYDSDGECGAGTVALELVTTSAVDLRSLLTRPTKGTFWYRCITDYPLCLFYCSIYDPLKRSGSVEHSF